jgi:hypothetical protein
VTQYSRSSNPSATSTTIFFPSSLIPISFLLASQHAAAFGFRFSARSG